MVEVTYNNLSGSPSNLITFTDIPNILKVTDSSGGTYASFYFAIKNNLYGVTSGDTQWYITFLGETITNVLDPSDAVNKSFYVARQNISTAASIAKAFRNCPTIIANFNVDTTMVNGYNAVLLTAKSVGAIWSNMQDYVKTNIPSENIEMGGEDGIAYSYLNGALIDVDVYSKGSYVTTLEKNWYNGEAAFNMSPILTTISEVGSVVDYTYKISFVKDGDYSVIGTIYNNYSSVGYMCNQGHKYLTNTSMNIAQNFSRGKSREFENNTLLYVYHPSIRISFYDGNLNTMPITVEYLDSAYNSITATTSQWENTDSNKKLWDLDIDLAENAELAQAFNAAFYIDITLGTSKVRYNVIKPLKATEYYQRILWRNSYGGISFFDFTGSRSETRDVDISTYQKNIFGYYDSPLNELEKVYDNEVKYNVTLKSHLFEHDGKYIFNDLIQSTQVWTEINGENYAIIIDSVNVEESDNNNIYTATVKYHYSAEPSLI